MAPGRPWGGRRPVSRYARFAGKAIVDIVADQVDRAVWVGQLLDGKAGQQ
jgi:hypothetical protein